MLMEGNTLETKKQVLIIGGGIFGLTAAIVLGEAGLQVTVIEKQKDVMLGASLVNQNRIHFGYHYPRSKATCLESMEGLQTFKEYFGESIHTDFTKYYAIAKNGSHLNASEFYQFCTNLNLSVKEAYPGKELLNRELVEACWITNEPIFDYNKLKQIAIYRIANCKNISVLRNVKPVSIKQTSKQQKKIELSDGTVVVCNTVVNATYAGISEISMLMGQKSIPAKYQLCLMPILEITKPIKPFGITIMDGQFCSLMPKGTSKNQFILYHVKHSVLQIHTGDQKIEWAPIVDFPELEIIEQSKKFFPILNQMKLCDSWLTTRIVLPEQEVDDARPSLILEHENRIYSLFSGKLTTCVSVARDLLIKLKDLPY